MPLFRSSLALKSFTQRSALLSTRQTIRPFSSTLPIRAHQGYGDGKGDPKGENPQDQGASNATKQNAEHPGPEPPAEGQGSGAGPTKGGSSGSSQKTPEDASAQSGGSRSKEAKETGSSPTGGEVGGGSGGKNSSSVEEKKTKIRDQKEPGEQNSREKDAEVEQHNREFEKGHDHGGARESEDKVDSKFWSGQGGADRQP